MQKPEESRRYDASGVGLWLAGNVLALAFEGLNRKMPKVNDAAPDAAPRQDRVQGNRVEEAGSALFGCGLG